MYEELDDKGFKCAALLSLSKAFDILNNDLLIAKLNANGFQNDALKPIYSYPTNRLRRIKIDAALIS